jgi:hypothetical protein
MASNVKDHLKRLQKRLNETGSYYIFYRDKKRKEYYLLAKEKSWKTAVSTTLKKLKKYKNPPKYVITAYIRTILKNINITSEDKRIVGGPLRLGITAYRVENLKDSDLQSYQGRSQNIWYTKDHLSERKFSFTDVKKAVKVVNEGEVTQNPFVIVTITDVLNSYES